MRVFVRAVPSLGAAFLAFSAALGGWQALVSCMLGVVGTAVFLWGTWTIVKLVGGTVGPQGPTSLQVVLTVVALLLKLPLIYAGWVVSKGLGPFGPTWFLLGLGLVYCVVIWRAVLAVRT